MKFIALKTEDGKKKGRIAFCCKMLGVSRQGFYRYLVNRNRPWKYQRLAEIMREICSEDQCNDTYGRMRMYQALRMKKPDGVEIPGEKTVYRIMKKIGLTHHPKRKPNGITKADREAMKSDDLLKRDFRSDEPLKKCITDITEIKAKDGKLYTSVIFDCFDLSVLGIAMSTNMKAELCVQTLDNAMNYKYTLAAYDENGNEKDVVFETSRVLTDQAFLCLKVNFIRGVVTWAEVEYEELPTEVQQYYSK